MATNIVASVTAGASVSRAYILGEVEYVTRDGKQVLVRWADGLYGLHLTALVERWLVVDKSEDEPQGEYCSCADNCEGNHR